MEKTKALLEQVLKERERQIVLWGTEEFLIKETNSFREYLVLKATVLGEEYGEVCRAILDKDPDNLRTECIQVAAVALAIIEGLDARVKD